jgi:hypothetical protein
VGIYTEEVIAKGRRFIELRETRDTAKEAFDKAKQEYADAEAEFWEELAPSDPNDPDYKLSAHKIPLGQPWGTVTFQPRETIYGKIIDDEAAFEYYEGRAMADDVTAPKFVMARINEEVREREEAGQPMPPGVDYYKTRYVSVTRPK